MKILYYARIHLTPYDGPSKHILAICKEMALRKHNIVLLTHPFENSLISGEFKAVQVPERGKRLHWLRRHWHLVWRLYGYGVSWGFRPEVIYQRDRGDDLFPLTLSQRFKMPLVVEVNGWLPDDAYRSDGAEARRRAIERLRPRYMGAAALITSSPGLRDLLIDTFRLPPSRVVYISNAADISSFAPRQQYRASGATPPVIGMVCGYHPQIDIEGVLQAVLLLYKRGMPLRCRLIVYGEGSAWRWRNKAEDMGILPLVDIIENVPASAIVYELWKMDIVLAAYKRECLAVHKSLEASMKIWEYWASQRPVIVTDTPGTYSYHHHLEKRFLAAEPENPQSLADAIEFLWQHPSLAEELARNGYQYVEKGHSWADTAREIENVLYKVVNKEK